MGYIYQGVNSTAYLQWQAWTKVMPAAGFHDRTRDYINNNPRRYFVKIRSAPADAEAAFAFVGKVCSDDGSTNQVDKNIVREADYLRGYHSTKYF